MLAGRDYRIGQVSQHQFERQSGATLNSFPATIVGEDRLRRIMGTLGPYFESLLEEGQGVGTYTIVDPDTGLPGTCCTQSQVAAFFALDHAIGGGQGDITASMLVRDVRGRQNADGSFSSNYNRAVGSDELKDVAEVGAAATALFHLYQNLGLEDAKEALTAAAEYLLTQVATENQGAVYKSAQAKHVDVLNGDIYAANTLARAFELTGSDRFLRKTIDIVDHVQGRFGAWRPGWWPYCETWDGKPAIGASLAYQATIVGFGMPICDVLPGDQARRWSELLGAALETVETQLPIGPTDDTEAPAWSRDWPNVWEIPLAFSRFPERSIARQNLTTRFEQLDASIKSSGINAFRPQSAHNPGKTPVTTLYRKAATFAGFLSDVCLPAANQQNADRESSPLSSRA